MKRIVAAFYCNESGREPVRDWLVDMAQDDRKTVGKDIATVEFGWPIGMPTCRPLREGVYEVRSTIRNGKVEARTYFAIEGSILLLLHGKEGKAGQNEAIETAIRRLYDHRRRERSRKRDDNQSIKNRRREEGG